MIGVTATVIPHDRANIFRNSVEIFDQIFNRFVFEIGFAFDRVVNVGDISLMMLL